MEYSYRAEIIANQSVEDDIIESLESEIENIEYAILPDVMGKGLHSKKLGDTVWPELNFLLLAYTDKEGAEKIKEAIERIRARFPKEGISLFFTQSVLL